VQEHLSEPELQVRAAKHKTKKAWWKSVVVKKN